MNSRIVCAICIALGLASTSPVIAAVNVFACEPEWASLAGEIGGANVVATSATNALQDPHYIQARPSLIASVRKADLLICSGSDLEAGWLPLLLRKGNNPRVQPGTAGNLMVSQFVKRLEIPTALDRSQGDIHAEGNPHIQTDPRNIGIVARVVAQRLQQIDPGNAQAYQQRLAAFEDKWNKAIVQWQRDAAPLKGREIVVYHKSWAYLNHWLGLLEVAALENKPGIPPSAAHLGELLAQLQASPAALIIRTPFQEAKPSEWLSAQTGIPQAVLPFTVGGTPQATDLFKLFDITIQILLDKMESRSE